MRYIDADSAKAIYLSKSAGEQLDRVPTADVEKVRHGKWIKENNQSYSPFDDSAEYVYVCNRCGYKDANENTDKTFCSRCGARMDGIL